MLARTYGQPASPVTLEKELQVFERLRSQRVGLAEAVYAAKFGGATSNSTPTGWLTPRWIGLPLAKPSSREIGPHAHP